MGRFLLQNVKLREKNTEISARFTKFVTPKDMTLERNRISV